MREQLAALFRLKWTIFRHETTKGLQFLGALATGLVAFCVGGLALVFFAAGIALGASGVHEKAPWVVMFVVDCATFIFLLMWIIGSMQEVQNQSFMDLGKMLYLPVPLRMVYFMNLLFAFLHPLSFLFLAPSIGLCLGLAYSKGLVSLIGIPVMMVYFAALLTWRQYAFDCVSAMSKRGVQRLMIVFSLVSVLPSIVYFGILGTGSSLHEKLEALGNVLAGSKASSASTTLEGGLAALNAIVPFGWHAFGMYALVTDNFIGVGLVIAGLLLVAAAGGTLGFRATLARFRGVPDAGKRLEISRAAQAPRRDLLVERQIPLFGNDTSAMFLTSMLRNARTQQMQLAVVITTVLILMFAGFAMYRGFRPPEKLGGFLRSAPLIMMIYPMIAMQFYSLNLFGTDHNGFRSLILLPTRRRKYFLARNLALLPFTYGQMAFGAIVCVSLLRTGFVSLVMALLMGLQLFVSLSIVGNLVSCYLPFRINTSGMGGAQTQPYIALLSALVFMLVFPFLLLPMGLVSVMDSAGRFIPGFERWPLGLLASVGLLAATCGAYYASLGLYERILMEREPRILDALVKDKK
ncbi:MAG: hypothetical protein AMXMBFR84_19170 [Candidatus Hydrogenedentota bacterium]